MNRVLLVVDDDEEIGLLFRLFLRKAFDAVLLARDSAEAEQFLSKYPVTHVVSDFTIGADEPLGTALLARWRKAFPNIAFTAIFTGAADKDATKGAEGIDAVFLKPNGFDALVAHLQKKPGA